MIADEFCDIVVIGGGPAGSTAAFLLASQGYDVIVVDKNRFPRPKLCAGLLTWKSIDLLQSIYHLSASEMMGLGIISHFTKDYRIYHGSTEIARGRLNYPFHFVERTTYDHFWLHTAGKAGARILTGLAARHVDPATGIVTLSNACRIRAQVIIGADGVWSMVRRSLFKGPAANRRWRRQLAMAIETRRPFTEGKTSLNFAALHFGFVPWGYAWCFPNHNHRVTGICSLRHKDNRPFTLEFQNVLTSIGFENQTPGANKGHPLPYGNYLQTPGRGRVLLVGDACGLADPLLGEGIYYAHRSAQIAALSIIACGADYSPLDLLYQRALNKKVLRELRWIKAYRNFLFAGGRHRRYRGLKFLLKIMPKRLEAAIQGQRPFSGLLRPSG